MAVSCGGFMWRFHVAVARRSSASHVAAARRAVQRVLAASTHFGHPGSDSCPNLMVLDLSDNAEMGGEVCVEMMGKPGARVLFHHHPYHTRHHETGKAVLMKGRPVESDAPSVIAMYTRNLILNQMQEDREYQSRRDHSIELQALIDMLNAIPQLGHLDGWDTLFKHREPRKLTGVTVGPEGWVLRIDLSNRELSGRIPESICKLKHMRLRWPSTLSAQNGRRKRKS